MMTIQRGGGGAAPNLPAFFPAFHYRKLCSVSVFHACLAGLNDAAIRNSSLAQRRMSLNLLKTKLVKGHYSALDGVRLLRSSPAAVVNLRRRSVCLLACVVCQCVCVNSSASLCVHQIIRDVELVWNTYTTARSCMHFGSIVTLCPPLLHAPAPPVSRRPPRHLLSSKSVPNKVEG